MTEEKEVYHGDERRAEVKVVVDGLSNGAKKLLVLGLSLNATLLLAIFSVLVAQARDLGHTDTEVEDHKQADDVRTQTLASAISNLTIADREILITIQRLLTQQENNIKSIDAINVRLDRMN